MKRPMFKPHYHVEPVREEGIFLLTENTHSVLTGNIYERVAPLIDGQRSVDDIVDCLAEELEPAKVYYAISLLKKKGYLMEGPTDEGPVPAAFWTARDLDPASAARALSTGSVDIKTLGGLESRPFSDALAGLGIRTEDAGDITIVLTDDYLREELPDLNRAAMEANRPWILVKPVGGEICIGPIFIPGKTGCWTCLETRYRRNREAEQFLMKKTGRTDPFPTQTTHSPATVTAACHMAASEVSAWMASDGPHRLEGKIISLDTQTWESRIHTLTRRPQCRTCGDITLSDPKDNFQPVRLTSGKVTFTADGGHRTVTPEETIDAYQHLVSPITGVVNLLERNPDVGSRVHVYLAGHNFAQGHKNLKSLKAGLRNMSAGKGMSKAQAKASGLCEGIERYSGIFEGYEPRISASYDSLGEKAIFPNDCMLYSDKQFEEREGTNQKDSKFNRVPEPFTDTSLELEWSPVWSLTHETVKYLPTQYLYYTYRYPDGNIAPVYFHACSNGNASGNTLEEAVLQGFFELVERDCVAQWWYNCLQKPAVDIASFNEPYFLELIDHYASLNRSVWALDLTSDLDIPTFVAVSKRLDQAEEEIIFGFGSHLDARSALQRALTEMNQSLPFVMNAANKDGKEAFGDDDALQWWRTATCDNQPYMAPDPASAPKTLSDYPSTRYTEIMDEIDTCRRRVEEMGMEMLVLDQTRPDLKVSVAKVIVPGMRHFWARFAPGRLYDVPVRMGWLKKPLTEDELNPIPVFF